MKHAGSQEDDAAPLVIVYVIIVALVSAFVSLLCPQHAVEKQRIALLKRNRPLSAFIPSPEDGWVRIDSPSGPQQDPPPSTEADEPRDDEQKSPLTDLPAFDEVSLRSVEKVELDLDEKRSY